MKPDGGGLPQGTVMDRIEAALGGHEGFKSKSLN